MIFTPRSENVSALLREASQTDAQLEIRVVHDSVIGECTIRYIPPFQER
jgi:hypothetical protein